MQMNAKNRKKKAKQKSAGSSGADSSATSRVFPDRPIIPPRCCRRSQLGKVKDYDGFRWYICRNGDTPGEVAWEFDLDAQMLVFDNSNIERLTRAAKLNAFTPLRIGPGKSPFLSPDEANRLLSSSPNEAESPSEDDDSDEEEDDSSDDDEDDDDDDDDSDDDDDDDDDDSDDSSDDEDDSSDDEDDSSDEESSLIGKRKRTDGLSDMKVPQLKAIGIRLGLSAVTGLSQAEWINLIRAQKQVKNNMATGPPPKKSTTRARKTELMPFGKQVFQCATCDSSYVGTWTGDWEDCYVLSTKFAMGGYMGRERMMETISALIPIQDQSLGLVFKGSVVQRVLPGCAKNLIEAGIVQGAKILEIHGTAVQPSHSEKDVVEMIRAVAERPCLIRFEWESNIVESYDVKILSDGMVCKNVSGRFVRHKFRTYCKSLSK
jgi:hypothetical protein